jgi:adenylate cyclase, class 2
MIEIEIKAQADHKALLSALKDAGATFEKTVDQHDTYYNAPHRDFGETDEALRLREQSGRVYMTYKGKKLDTKSKTRKEVEVEVMDRTKMDDILLSLSFKKTLEVKKKRDIYHLSGVEVCVDRVEGLGDYVELEAMAEDMKDMPEKRDMLIDTMRKLGVKGELIRESYLEMLLTKKMA